MRPIRLGQIEFLNCLPIYYAFETGRLPMTTQLIKGTPTELNALFFRDELEITPISSIEYARHPEKCLILPDLSVSSDGRVGSIFLISKVPVAALEGRKVCLPSSSATSVVLLKVLFQQYYRVEVEFETTPPDLELMLSRADAALLIGDEALHAYHQLSRNEAPLLVVDLGEAWKKFTGERMVYALWVVRRDYAREHPQEVAEFTALLHHARQIGRNEHQAVVDLARERTGLPRGLIEEYFELVRLGLDADYQRGLLTYYDQAYQAGLIPERVKLNFWGDWH